ncbi:MAG: hypothetical protein ABIH78_00015 [Candidatus Peregrinibacteria bacterium]
MKKIALVMMGLSLFLTACSTSTTTTVAPPEMPELTSADCFGNSVLYEVPDSTLKFCYKEEWGMPVVSGTAEEGKVTVSFDGDAVSPEISYISTDSEDGFCFDCIIPELPEENLVTAFAEETGLASDSFNLRKVHVYGVRGIRVHYTRDGVDSLSFFVPNAFDGYNLDINGPNSIASEIDDMSQMMIAF